jgi:hypothetical protein
MDYYDQVKKDRVGMMETTGPDAIMRYGGFCPKKMPMESNNPRTIQGQKLRRGGCVKKMKQGGYK